MIRMLIPYSNIHPPQLPVPHYLRKKVMEKSNYPANKIQVNCNFIKLRSKCKVCYVLDKKKQQNNPVVEKQSDTVSTEDELQDNQAVLHNQPGVSNWNQVCDNNSAGQSTG